MRTRLSLALLHSLAVTLACSGDDGGTTAGGTETDGGTTGTGTTGGSTSTTTGGSTGGTTGATDSGGSTGGGAVCGDGIVDDGEQCDDGNADDTDACNNACVPLCGIETRTPMDFSVLANLAVGALTSENDGITLVGAGPNDPMGQTHSVFVRNRFEKAGPLGAAEMGGMLGGPADLLASIRVASDGDLIVLGVNVPPNSPAVPFLARVSGTDFATVWKVDVASGTPAVTAGRGSMELLSAGDIILSDGINVTDGNDDVRVRRFAFADGAEVWSETFSGPDDNGNSQDGAGPVAVGPGDVIFAVGVLRIDYQTHNATVVQYGADGGAPVSTVEALVDPGNNHLQQRDLVRAFAGDDGSVYVGIPAYGNSNSSELAHVVKVKDAAVVWDWVTPELGPDGSWRRTVEGLVVDDMGRVVVNGAFVQPYDDMVGIFTLYTAVLSDADGTELCLRDHSRPSWTMNSRHTGLWPDNTPAIPMTDTEFMGAAANAFVATIRMP